MEIVESFNSGMTGVTKENLIVKFDMVEVESMFRFNEDGTPFKTWKEQVTIRIPGTEEVFKTTVRDQDKVRFSKEYLQWKAGQRGNAPVEGVRLEAWARLSPAKVEQLKALGFVTVEQIATCTDSNVNRMGFDGHTIRREAIQFLKEHKEEKVDDSIKLAKEALELKLAETQAELSEQAKLTAKLMERLEALENKPAQKKKG
jgi:hypothetical protein